jgi:hypothetical protein
MLFPGHEIDQLLVANLADKAVETEAQERCEIEKKANVRSFQFRSARGRNLVKRFSDFPGPQPKQHLESTLTQTRAIFKDRWPNGISPTGPQKCFQRNGQLRSWQQSSVSESNGSISKVTVQRQSLSSAHHLHRYDSLTAALLDEINADEDKKPSQTSSSRLSCAAQPGRLEDMDEASASVLTPHSMLKESICKMNLVSGPPSESALRSVDLDHTKEAVAIQPFEAGTSAKDLALLDRHSSTAAPAHYFAQAKSTAMIVTGSPIRAEIGTTDAYVDSSSTGLSPCLPVWQAKLQGRAMRGKSTSSSRQLAPSSQETVPPVIDRTTCYSTGLALSVFSSGVPRSVKDSKGYPRIYSHSVDGLNRPAEERHTPLRTVARLSQQLLPESSSVMPSTFMDLSSSDNLTLEISSELHDSCSLTSAKEAHGQEESLSAIELNVPDTSCVLGTKNTTSGTVKTSSAEMPQSTSMPTPTTVKRNSCNNEQTVKKLCTRCHKPILGPTSTCIQCRSKENRSNDHPCTACSPTTSVTVSVEKPFFPCPSNEASSAEQSHLQHAVVIPAPKCVKTGIQRSPFVPETPDLVSDNKIFTPVDEVAAPKFPKPAVPRRRPAVCSTVVNNEHCFSKKKPRIFRPVTESQTVHVPPVKPKKSPHTPIGHSPLVENNLRDARVQNSVETDHRGTSSCSTHGEMADRLQISAKESATPDTCSSQVTSRRDNAAVVDEASGVPAPFSQHSSGNSKQVRMQKRCSKSLGRQVKDFSQCEQDFKQAEAAVARLQKIAQNSNQYLRQKSRITNEKCSNSTRRREVDKHLNINPCYCADDEACKWTPDDEKALLQKLQDRGVIFEEGSSSDSDTGIPPPQTKPVPKDPFWRCPYSSTDLFLIAPHLSTNHSSFDVERKRMEIAARPPRKQRRRNMSYLRQKRGENIHEEVKRSFAPRRVKASSTEISEHMDLMHVNAHGTATEQGPEAEMTFCDFIGAPARPVAILTKDKQLAFRDGTRDIRGSLPRTRERFIVTDRNVACMER